MKTYDEFKKKNADIKLKEKELKKQKMKNKVDLLTKKKQDVISRMNKYVAGFSEYN